MNLDTLVFLFLVALTKCSLAQILFGDIVLDKLSIMLDELGNLYLELNDSYGPKH